MRMTTTMDGSATPGGGHEDAVGSTGIDPDRLALCLDVIAEAELLDPEHPDAVAVRRATEMASLMATRRAQAPGRSSWDTRPQRR